MGSSYTRCNFIRVTLFLDHRFLKNPIVKKMSTGHVIIKNLFAIN